MIAPTWEALFGAVDELALPERSYPYSYQDLRLIKPFVYARIKDITAFQSLQKHLMMCPGVLALVGLEKAPHRKTLAARFRALLSSVLSLLHQLTKRFIETGAVNPSIGSVDSTLMHAQGNVWHKKQRDQGELPSCGNIDTQAYWGRNGCGKWVYGYRLHSLTLCGPEGITWPATIGVHAANLKDADVFDDELVHRLPKATQVLLGDGGYDLESCYRNCDEREVTLLAPIKVKKTRRPSGANEPGSTKIPAFVRSLLYAKPPSSPFRVNSKTSLAWSVCP